MFKVSNKNTRTSLFFIVNFEHVSNLFSSVCIIAFEQVNAIWVSFIFSSNSRHFKQEN